MTSFWRGFLFVTMTHLLIQEAHSIVMAENEVLFNMHLHRTGLASSKTFSPRIYCAPG
jgi:hypothetical protein